MRLCIFTNNPGMHKLKNEPIIFPELSMLELWISEVDSTLWLIY